MRRADREIREFDRMLAVADACDCCRLGLLDDAGAYIVPLNFGYEAEGETACAYSYRYQSVMGRGRIRLIEEYEEKVHGLQAIMAHYSRDREFAFGEEAVNRTAVIKLEVEAWSCKEH